MPFIFNKELFGANLIRHKIIAYSITVQNTKPIQESSQSCILLICPEMGVLSIILINILIIAKNVISKSEILPGYASGGTKKLKENELIIVTYHITLQNSLNFIVSCVKYIFLGVDFLVTSHDDLVFMNITIYIILKFK